MSLRRKRNIYSIITIYGSTCFGISSFSPVKKARHGKTCLIWLNSYRTRNLHGILSTQCGACSPRILRMKRTVCGFCFFLDPCAVGLCSRFLLTMWKNSFREIMKKKISRPSGVHGANLRASHQQGRERTLEERPMRLYYSLYGTNSRLDDAYFCFARVKQDRKSVV